MTTSHKTKWRESLIRLDKPCLTTRRTCPFCGEDFIEHDTSTDRLGTLGSVYIDGVHYIVPMQVVSAYDRTREENKRLSARCIETSEKLIALTDAIDNFLNDTREKESVEELERAMKGYGMIRLEADNDRHNP